MVKKLIYLVCSIALFMCASIGSYAASGCDSQSFELSQPASFDFEAAELAIAPEPVRANISIATIDNRQTANHSTEDRDLALNTVTDSPLERYDKPYSI